MSTKLLVPFFMLFFLLMACEEEENEPEHFIVSEEFSDGIFYAQYLQEGTSFSIETSDSSATFSAAEDKTTLDISAKGSVSGQYEPGLYWVNVNWANGEEDLLPVVVTPYPEQARNTFYALSHMENESENYVVVLRHANANEGEDAGDASGIPDWWMSCDSEVARQLDDTGMNRARRIGVGFSWIKMPIGLGISSEFCRAKQTFEYMELDFPVEIDGRLNHRNHNISPNSTYEDLEDIILENPQDDGVLLLVGHSNLLEDNPYSEQIGEFNMSDGFLMKREGDQVNFVGAIPFWYWRVLCDCLKKIKGKE